MSVAIDTDAPIVARLSSGCNNAILCRGSTTSCKVLFHDDIPTELACDQYICYYDETGTHAIVMPWKKMSTIDRFFMTPLTNDNNNEHSDIIFSAETYLVQSFQLAGMEIYHLVRGFYALLHEENIPSVLPRDIVVGDGIFLSKDFVQTQATALLVAVDHVALFHTRNISKQVLSGRYRFHNDFFGVILDQHSYDNVDAILQHTSVSGITNIKTIATVYQRATVISNSLKCVGEGMRLHLVSNPTYALLN